jgi:AbiV family abortive infection protein
MTLIEAKRTRKLVDVVRAMPEADFLGWVAEGLVLVLKHAERLHRAQVALTDSRQHHAARIVHSICEEEAAKFLILVDIVRCPRNPDLRAEQARRFEDHIAKGIYARSCGMKPGTLGELQGFLHFYRERPYLDGPDGDNWEFGNEILRQREGTMYVDYVSIDETNCWVDPGRNEELMRVGDMEPAVLRLSRALAATGISAKRGLEVVAEVWQPVALTDQTTWNEVRQVNQRTLEALESLGALEEASRDVYEQVIDGWQFPMYGLDLSAIKRHE